MVTETLSPDEIQALIAEGPVSVAEVAATMKSRRGKARSPYTVTVWIVNGKRGQRLEGYFGPDGTWWTSWPALARFFATLTARQAGRPLPERQSEGQRRAAKADAERAKLRQADRRGTRP